MVWVLSLLDMDLSTHALTLEYKVIAFGVCLELVGGEAPASNQSLYLYNYRVQGCT